MNRRNGFCCWLLIGALALAGCQEKTEVTATEVECRDRPPVGETEREVNAALYGMSYGEFRLGQSARAVEDLIAKHPEWTAVSRADCDGVLYVRAGGVAHPVSGAVCDVGGQKQCELVQATMQRATPGAHVLTNLTYAHRLQGKGRLTRGVLDELKTTYGEPLWQYAARRSPGWPDLRQGTNLIWFAQSDRMPGAVPDTNFQEEVIKRLGAGDYLIVSLEHNQDVEVTYAITVELRRVNDVRSPDKATTRESS